MEPNQTNFGHSTDKTNNPINQLLYDYFTNLIIYSDTSYSWGMRHSRYDVYLCAQGGSIDCKRKSDCIVYGVDSSTFRLDFVKTFFVRLLWESIEKRKIYFNIMRYQSKNVNSSFQFNFQQHTHSLCVF